MVSLLWNINKNFACDDYQLPVSVSYATFFEFVHKLFCCYSDKEDEKMQEVESVSQASSWVL